MVTVKPLERRLQCKESEYSILGILKIVKERRLSHRKIVDINILTSMHSQHRSRARPHDVRVPGQKINCPSKIAQVRQKISQSAITRLIPGNPRLRRCQYLKISHCSLLSFIFSLFISLFPFIVIQMQACQAVKNGFHVRVLYLFSFYLMTHSIYLYRKFSVQIASLCRKIKQFSSPKLKEDLR